ncbi:SOSS complex subunit C homolog isoform X2 [Aplysia californica]|uniref:SOSS complex subunit C homolog isoform X2 n=1 Tax=Aplysia californica TaxID=6500 RepID=A0ABM1VYI3_APLCA|nr:SOSS complex subunit C homolog isoform X2 [Aplysia californica]
MNTVLDLNPERQNRKLLEHIQEQKKRFQHGHHAGPGSAAGSMTPSPAPLLNNPPSAIPGLSAAEYATISNPQQRAALQHAHVSSVGYFITQDSAFGNLILPVLPRVTDGKMETK